jgi:hypothetical protein
VSCAGLGVLAVSGLVDGVGVWASGLVCAQLIGQ